MTRLGIILTTAGFATGALAHPGHLASAGGHEHWELLGGIAVLALAVGVAAWACRRT
jgi:hypothetical protein